MTTGSYSYVVLTETLYSDPVNGCEGATNSNKSVQTLLQTPRDNIVLLQFQLCPLKDADHFLFCGALPHCRCA